MKIQEKIKPGITGEIDFSVCDESLKQFITEIHTSWSWR